MDQSDDLDEFNTQPSLVLINFPGNVKNEKTAIGLLGKMEKLRQSFPPENDEKEGEDKDKSGGDSTPAVELRFRPGDVLSQPIKGVTRKTKKLLLKITTEGETSSRNQRITNVSLEGVINKEVVFENLSDFARVEGTKHNFENPNDQKYNLPAITFSTKTQSTPYSITTKKMIEKKERIQGKRDRRSVQRKKKGALLYDFDVPNVPTEPDESIKRDILDKRLLKYVRELFDNRPIWLPLNIEIMCKKKFPTKKVTLNILKLVLQQVSYKFKNGPFKRVYIKYGIDPRRDSSMAKYQTVDFRPKVDSWGTEPSVFYDRPPNKQITYFQICDIRIRNVIDFLEKDLTLLNSCKIDYGWYRKLDIVDKIPQFMKEKLNEWLEEEGFHLVDKDIDLPKDEIYDILRKKKKKKKEDEMDMTED